MAFVVTKTSASASADGLTQFVNSQVGKTQRGTAHRFLDELPRGAIGKVQKLVLREEFVAI